MRVKNMMQPEGRVFLKSEGAPIRAAWPCVSFTRKSACENLMQQFQHGRDVLIHVGTTNPEVTTDPLHRSRLLSAVSLDTTCILDTESLVAPPVWEAVTAGKGTRLQYSLGLLETANMQGPPWPAARKVAPAAYTLLGRYINRGGVVEATGVERNAVMEQNIEPVWIKTPETAAQTNTKRPQDDITRMMGLIMNRVKRSGLSDTRHNPFRDAPARDDLRALLECKWQDQGGHCVLCGGALVADSSNGMLKASPDRIDSANPSYGSDNLQITHLACNLAKNRYGESDFQCWLEMVRANAENP